MQLICKTAFPTITAQAKTGCPLCSKTAFTGLRATEVRLAEP